MRHFLVSLLAVLFSIGAAFAAELKLPAKQSSVRTNEFDWLQGTNVQVVFDWIDANWWDITNEAAYYAEDFAYDRRFATTNWVFSRNFATTSYLVNAGTEFEDWLGSFGAVRQTAVMGLRPIFLGTATNDSGRVYQVSTNEIVDTQLSSFVLYRPDLVSPSGGGILTLLSNGWYQISAYGTIRSDSPDLSLIAYITETPYETTPTNTWTKSGAASWGSGTESSVVWQVDALIPATSIYTNRGARVYLYVNSTNETYRLSDYVITVMHAPFHN